MAYYLFLLLVMSLNISFVCCWPSLDGSRGLTNLLSSVRTKANTKTTLRWNDISFSKAFLVYSLRALAYLLLSITARILNVLT